MLVDWRDKIKCSAITAMLSVHPSGFPFYTFSGNIGYAR
jgi:hypothetical protein